MTWVLRFVLLSLLFSQVRAGESATGAIPAQDLGTTVAKLSSSVDRLASLLEKEVALRAEEGKTRRVEIAVGILDVRYRKIERIETEIQEVSHQEEETVKALGLMKVEVDRLGKLGRTETAELGEAAKGEIASLEPRIKSEEEHLARLRERSLVLQADLAAEKKQVAGVEAVVNAWMATP